MKRLIVVTLLAAVLFALPTSGQTPKEGGSGQQSSPPPAPAQRPAEVTLPDVGRLEGTQYVNDYFGLSFSIPASWTVEDSTAKRAMLEAGAKAITPPDGKNKEQIEASVARSYYIISAHKYPRGTPSAGFNAHFGFYVERVPTAIVKTGGDYLRQMVRTSSMTAVKIEPVGAVRAVKIGGADFDTLDTKMTLPNGVTAAQRWYVTVRQKVSLTFVLTYIDDDDVKTLEEVMKSVKFK